VECAVITSFPTAYVLDEGQDDSVTRGVQARADLAALAEPGFRGEISVARKNARKPCARLAASGFWPLQREEENSSPSHSPGTGKGTGKESGIVPRAIIPDP